MSEVNENANADNNVNMTKQNSSESLLHAFGGYDGADSIVMDNLLQNEPSNVTYNGTLMFPDFVTSLTDLIGFWSAVSISDDQLMQMRYYIDSQFARAKEDTILNFRRIYEVTNNIAAEDDYTNDPSYLAEIKKLTSGYVFPYLMDMRHITKIYGMFYQFMRTVGFTQEDKNILLSLKFYIPGLDASLTINEIFNKYCLNENDFIDVFHNQKFDADKSSELLDSFNELKNYMYTREDAELRMEHYLWVIANNVNPFIEQRQ